MKKIILLLISIALFSAFILPPKTKAMMDSSYSNNFSANEDLSDEEYQRLGEEWMKMMMGERHEEMDEQIRQRMGEEFLREMHITMGKRSQNPEGFDMIPMMAMMGGDFSMMEYSSMMGWGGGFSILGLITWLALIAFLITGAVFFWKNSQKK